MFYQIVSSLTIHICQTETNINLKILLYGEYFH